MTKLRLLVAVGVWLSTSMMYAGGFQLSECGVKAVGMGSAFASGLGKDASTLFYNPAGMTQLPEGLHFTGGLSYIAPRGSFVGPTNFNNTAQTTTMNAWDFPIPNFYAVYSMPSSNLSFGLGVFVPFGLGTEYPADWTGRNLAVKTYLQTITINPNIAYKMLDGKLSLAAGVSYNMGKVELERAASLLFNPEPTVNLKGDGNTISWNAALSYEITKDLRFGASYRHNLDFTYDGEATYSNISGLESKFVNGPGGTALNLPYDLRTGLSYQLSKSTLVEFSFDYVGWSSYDTLSINFSRGPGAPYKVGGGDSASVVANPRNYFDQYILRLGIEHELSDDLTLRCGFVYDPAAVDAKNTQPFLPDVNKYGVSVGASYKISDAFSIDAAYFGINGSQRVVEGSPVGFDGIYKAYANIYCVGLNYSLK